MESRSHVTAADFEQMVSQVETVKERADEAVQSAARLGVAMKSIATSTQPSAHTTPAPSLSPSRQASRHPSRPQSRPTSRQVARGAAPEPPPPAEPAPLPVPEPVPEDSERTGGMMHMLLDRLSHVENSLSPELLTELDNDVGAAIQYATTANLEIRKLIRQLSQAFPEREWGGDAAIGAPPSQSADTTQPSLQPPPTDAPAVSSALAAAPLASASDGLVAALGPSLTKEDEQILREGPLLPASALGDVRHFCTSALQATFAQLESQAPPPIPQEEADDELEARLSSVQRLEEELREALTREEMR